MVRVAWMFLRLRNHPEYCLPRLNLTAPGGLPANPQVRGEKLMPQDKKIELVPDEPTNGGDTAAAPTENATAPTENSAAAIPAETMQHWTRRKQNFALSAAIFLA
jgi:hypothetical protein